MFFNNLLHQTLGNSRIRKKKGRTSVVCEMTNTIESLLQKYIDQKGRDYYGHHPLSLKINADFICSVERLDNKKGETVENTVLTCVEFNTGQHIHWSRDLISLCEYERSIPIDYKELERIIISIRDLDKSSLRKPQKRHVYQFRSDGSEIECIKCNNWYPTPKRGYSKGCPPCHTKTVRDYLEKHPRNFVQVCLNHAKFKAGKRKHRGNQSGEYTLTMEWVIEQLRRQNVRCAISGVQLTFSPKGRFQMSIERVDENKGYTPDNCILIALEFNTTTKQWNKEKWEFVLNNFHTFFNNAFPLPRPTVVDLSSLHYDVYHFSNDYLKRKLNKRKTPDQPTIDEHQ